MALGPNPIPKFDDSRMVPGLKVKDRFSINEGALVDGPT
eukprot:CAMPEP_0184683496 /NCGR_PEP_ID=MMETSP0312-20130426/11573_1 /TAXON_ID=31354 /ORGANISM="Compsopogon coeruleus, Strain SAG 36.94" /LENGTH=38 /DNA_ID= /DNA_START= /DNA_END= /DNA_ORIENTATION=